MRPRLYVASSLLLGLVLAIGVAVVWAVVMAWCGSVIESVNRGNQVSESVYFLPDGRPVIVSAAYYGYETIAMRTLDGQEVPETARQSIAYPTHLPMPQQQRVWRWPLGWNQRIVGMNDSQRPPNYWYLVHDGQRKGRAYLVGYNSATERQVGYIGRGGFRPTQPPPDDCFAIDGRRMATYGAVAARYRTTGYIPISQVSYGPNSLLPWLEYLVTDDGLAAVDLRARTVQFLPQPAEVPLAVSVISMPLPKSPELPEEMRPTRQDLLLVYSDRIEAFDPRTGDSVAYALPAEMQSKRPPYYYVHMVPSGELVLMNHGTAHDPATRLTWIASGGGVTRREEVVLKSSESWLNDRPEWTATACVPNPLMSAAITLVVLPMSALETGEVETYSAGLARSWTQSWLPFVLMFGLNLIPVWLVWRRQRAFAGRGTMAWMILVYLLGPAGLAGYWFHRRWPARATLLVLSAAGALAGEEVHPAGGAMPAPAHTGLEIYG